MARELEAYGFTYKKVRKQFMLLSPAAAAAYRAERHMPDAPSRLSARTLPAPYNCVSSGGAA
jgi:hypothetical protein